MGSIFGSGRRASDRARTGSDGVCLSWMKVTEPVRGSVADRCEGEGKRQVGEVGDLASTSRHLLVYMVFRS